MIFPIAAVAVIALACAAVATDLRVARVPNWLTLPALGFGVGLAALEDGLPGLGMSMAGAGVGLLLFIVPVFAGRFGAGDLKLLAAMGALMGPMFAAMAFAIGAALGALMALGVFGWLVGVQRRSYKVALAARFPYAPALAGGALGALLLGAGA